MNTGNHTRPDNVFASQGIVDTLESCNTAEDETPPRTDHFPIITRIATSSVRMPTREIRNFREADWRKFEMVLKPKIEGIPTNEVGVREELDDRLKRLTEATKRWWSKEKTQSTRTYAYSKINTRKGLEK